MNDVVKREIIKLKGNGLSFEFVERFEKEWLEVTARLKRSNKDLTRILIVTK